MSLLDDRLSLLSRNMEQLHDLLLAEDIELQQLLEHIHKQEQEVNLTTSVDLLPRFEQIFSVPTNTQESKESRSARLLAKLLGHGNPTKKVLQQLASNYYSGEVNINEYPVESVFEVELSGPLGLPVNWEGMKAAIDEIKPAHLFYDYSFIYQTSTMPVMLGCFVRVSDQMTFIMER